MRAEEIIFMADSQLPNEQSDEVKMSWLRAVEGRIQRVISGVTKRAALYRSEVQKKRIHKREDRKRIHKSHDHRSPEGE